MAREKIRLSKNLLVRLGCARRGRVIDTVSVSLFVSVRC